MELPFALIALAWAIVAYIIYSSLNLILTSRRHARMARELKCEEPPFQHNKYPGGIDNILRALAADKEKQFPVDMIQRAVDAGSITYRYSILGATNVTTSDEKNIQALLATQFADFGEWFIFLCLKASPRHCSVGRNMRGIQLLPYVQWVGLIGISDTCLRS
jgi:hypothetical protein